MADTILASPSIPLDTQQKCPDPSVHTIPDDATHAVIQISRSTTADPSKFPNPDTHIVIVGFVSYDGGQTWEHGGTSTTSGGITAEREGDIGYSQVMFAVAPGKNRLLRSHVAIICGPPVMLDAYVATRVEATVAVSANTP